MEAFRNEPEPGFEDSCLDKEWSFQHPKNQATNWNRLPGNAAPKHRVEEPRRDARWADAVCLCDTYEIAAIPFRLRHALAHRTLGGEFDPRPAKNTTVGTRART